MTGYDKGFGPLVPVRVLIKSKPELWTVSQL